MTVVSALQIGSQPAGTAATLAHIQSFSGDIRNAGAALVVMPAGLLGGYPKGADFGARLGFRTQGGRQAYRSYWEAAIDVPGPETKALADLSSSASSNVRAIRCFVRPCSSTLSKGSSQSIANSCRPALSA